MVLLRPFLLIFSVLQVWEQSKLPTLSLRASRPEELANAHLVIVIMDYDRMDSVSGCQRAVHDCTSE